MLDLEKIQNFFIGLGERIRHITVIAGIAPAILGYNTCNMLGIIKIINNISSSEDYKKQYPNVFCPHIGKLKDFEEKLDIDN